MMRAQLGLISIVLAAAPACEQYHPTAPAHIRPASERDRAFAAKVGEEADKRKIVNQVETRAGGIVEPMLDAREGLVRWRLSLAGPVAVVEGSLDGRAFAGVYWTREDRVIRKREMIGALVADLEQFALGGRSRMRGPGDTRNLVTARDVVSGKAEPPAGVRFRDGLTGRADGGARAFAEAIGAGAHVRDGWCIDDVVALLSDDGLYVLSFDELRIVEISRYADSTAR